MYYNVIYGALKTFKMEAPNHHRNHPSFWKQRFSKHQLIEGFSTIHFMVMIESRLTGCMSQTCSSFKKRVFNMQCLFAVRKHQGGLWKFYASAAFCTAAHSS